MAARSQAHRSPGRRVRSVVATLLFVVLAVTVAAAQGVVIVALSLLVWTQGPAGHERLRTLIEHRVQRQLPGFRLGALRGDLPREIVLVDVTVDDAAGQPAVHVAEIRARVDLRALLARRVRLERLTVTDPRVRARRLGDGRLSLADLVTPGPPGAPGAAWPLEVAAVTVSGGAASYVDAGQETAITGLTVHGALRSEAGTLAAELSLGVQASRAGQTIALELAAAGAVTGETLALRVDRLVARGLTPAGAITLRGEAHGALARLRVAIAGALPGGATAQVDGVLGLDGALTYDLTASVRGLDPGTLVATWPAGELTATAHAVGRGAPLTPGAAARGTLDLRPSRLAAIDHLSGRLTAELVGDAWRVSGLTAEVPGLAVTASGHGSPARLVLDLTAALDRPSAVAYLPRALHGRARLRAHAVVAWPLSLELLQAQVSATGVGYAGASVGALTLDVDAAGPWLRPRGDARLHARGVRLGPSAPRLDRVTLSASSRHERLHVSAAAAGAAVNGALEARGTVTAQGARVTLQRLRARYGAYALVLQEPAELRWQPDGQASVRGLRVAALGGEVRASATYRAHARAQPWLEAHVVTRHLVVPRAPVPLDAEVALRLARDRLDAQGRLGLGGARPVTFTASLPVRAGRTVGLPRLAAHGAVALKLDAAGLAFSALPAPLRAQLELTSGTADVRADVSGDIAAPLGRLTAELHGVALAGVTGLDARATVTGGPRDLDVAASVDVHGARLLTAHAHVDPTLAAAHGLPRLPLAVDVAIPGFDLARLRAARPQLVALQGVLTGTGRLTGTVAHPEGRAELAVADAVIGGVPFAGLTARGEYRGAALAVTVASTQRAGGVLQARVWRTPAASVRASLTAQHFDLAFLQPLMPKLHQAAGYLEAQLDLQGTLAAPRVSGVIALHRGVIEVIGVPAFREVELLAHVTNEQLRIDSLASKVGAGTVQLSGRLGVRGWLPVSLQARLQVRALPLPVETLTGATLDADVTADGALAGRKFDANVHVTYGRLKIPRLDSDRELWSTAPMKGVSFIGDPQARPAVAAGRSFLPEAIQVSLTVASFQVHGKDFDATVGAHLVLNAAGGETRVRGEVDATSGSVALFNNRYLLERAHVRFDGHADPNPALDLRLTRRFPEAEVAVTVRGTARHPAISFSSDPAIYGKAGIVSLIVTGEAADSPNAGDNDTNNAISTISTVLVRDLTQRIVPVLPIDIVNVQRLSQGQLQQERETQIPSQLPSDNVTRLEVGKRITNRIQVGYVHIFGANQDENANEALIKYRLTAHWSLQSQYGDAGVGGLDLMWSRRY